MKRLIEYLPFVVLGLAGCIIAAVILEHREAKHEEAVAIQRAKPMEATAPEGKNQTSVDRGLIHEVFNDPAKLDSLFPGTGEIVITDNVGEPEAEPKSEMVLGGVSLEAASEWAVVEGDDLEAYASLRSDAVRNPDSEQNRIVAESIMRKRNKRVKQLGLD